MMGIFYKIRKKIGILLIGKTTNKKSQVEIFQELGLVKIDDTSDVTNINVQIRKSDVNKQYLRIGRDSVVGGSFIFENDNIRNNLHSGACPS